MEGTSILSSIIIFIYLIIIFLIMYYRNKFLNRKQNKVLSFEKINPTINFYCYDLFNGNKLMWITLLELVNKKYYKLELVNNELIIKYNKKNFDIDDIKIEEYQKDIIRYMNSFMKNNSISVKELYYLVRTDCNFNNVLNEYIIHIKKSANSVVGNIDRANNYKFSIICTFIYCMQVIYFISKEINLVGNILISLPLTYLTITLCDLLKNKIRINDKKKYIIIFQVFLVCSLITSGIWNNNTGNNYLLFHFLMGIFTYLYPLLLIVDIYLIKENYAYKNDVQNNLVKQINELRKNKVEEIDYLYVKALKIKNKKKDNLIDKYFEILDL